MKERLSEVQKYSVTQSNYLIEACYTLSLDEKRLILAAIAKINPFAESPGIVEVTGEEFCQLFALNPKTGYQQLKAALDRLYERSIRRIIIDREQNIVEEEMRWVYGKGKTRARSGKVTIRFSPELLPHLCQLQDQFTRFKIFGMHLLGDFETIRLYELLVQYRDIGYRWISVKEFREIMNLDEKYGAFKKLRQRIIDPAVREITEKTNLAVTYTVEKKGREVDKIWFYFSEKPQMSLDI